MFGFIGFFLFSFLFYFSLPYFFFFFYWALLIEGYIIQVWVGGVGLRWMASGGDE